MRLFIALNLPEDVKERLAAEVLAPLRQALPNVRWVRPETLHLTLVFLGDCTDAQRRGAEAAVRWVAAAHAPFAARFTHLGVFPNRARPRVVWAGLADPAPVGALHHALMQRGLGTKGAAQAYHPHLTLGRVPPAATADVRRALPAVLRLSLELSAPFSTALLMQSTLTPTGPHYQVLLSAPLRGATSRSTGLSSLS
jgi:2'-5' RNA ligase